MLARCTTGYCNFEMSFRNSQHLRRWVRDLCTSASGFLLRNCVSRSSNRSNRRRQDKLACCTSARNFPRSRYRRRWVWGSCMISSACLHRNYESTTTTTSNHHLSPVRCPRSRNPPTNANLRRRLRTNYPTWQHSRDNTTDSSELSRDARKVSSSYRPSPQDL